jgi:hypothetical protein
MRWLPWPTRSRPLRAAGARRPIICPEAFTGYNVDAVGDLAQPADRPFARDVRHMGRSGG